MRVCKNVLVLAGVAVVLAAVPASAHHSFAMFDFEKSMTLEGTVKEFRWGNPHSYVRLLVKDQAKGAVVEWSLESFGTALLTRRQWKRNSIKSGDKAMAVIHPAKDGSISGFLVSISVNGQLVGVKDAQAAE